MPTETLLHPKFKDLPTRSIRVSAFTFGLEKHFAPNAQFRQRMPYPKMREEIDAALAASTLADSDLSARQWPKWVRGDLRNEPNYLRKLADALDLDAGVSAVLDFDAANRSVDLFLRMLDVLAYRSAETVSGTRDARMKQRTARDGLEKLQRTWAVGNEPGAFQLPRGWLVDGEGAAGDANDDHPLIYDAARELRTGESVSSLRRRPPSVLNFYLQGDLLWRYEPDAPLTMLQFLLRFLLHIDSQTFVPIQTFAVDLATASLAMSTLFYWDDERLFSRFGAKMEAIDAAASIFFSEKIALAQTTHLIKKDIPWIYDGPNNVEHIPKLLESLRMRFDTALESYGISPRKIRQIYSAACMDALYGNFGEAGESVE